MTAPNSAAFIPVIIGTDLNAYHMAASFHEAYGVRPHVIGKVRMGFTHYSSIIEQITYVEDLDKPEVFVPALREYATGLNDLRPLVLVGTNDHYVRLIIEHGAELGAHYRFNYPTEELLNQVQSKDQFYPLAQEHGLAIPQTQVHQVGDPVNLEFTRYPVIIKPGHGVEYYRNKFAGQEKVYRVHSAGEAEAVIEKIAASGYRETLIIQDYIPGDDTLIWDSVLYLNTEGKAEFVNFGQVLLQEHEASAIGNYTAILSRFQPEIMAQLKDFLEAIGYTGIANVDLKYDSRDGEFKVLEVNIRQGRSSWYATAQGENLAAHLVQDLVHHQRSGQCRFVDKPVLFTVVPQYILRRYVTAPDVQGDVRDALASKIVRNPLYYGGDKSVLRRAWLAVRGLRYRKKYASATWREES